MNVRGEIVALALVVLALVGVPAAMIAYDTQFAAGNPPGTITLVGRTPLHGNWSQREIRVKAGDTLRIRLTSEDVTHGFYVPDLDVNAGPISPGQFKTVEILAERTGSYNFYCNILCSHEHGAMLGKIVVE